MTDNFISIFLFQRLLLFDAASIMINHHSIRCRHCGKQATIHSKSYDYPAICNIKKIKNSSKQVQMKNMWNKFSYVYKVIYFIKLINTRCPFYDDSKKKYIPMYGQISITANIIWNKWISLKQPVTFQWHHISIMASCYSRACSGKQHRILQAQHYWPFAREGASNAWGTCLHVIVENVKTTYIYIWKENTEVLCGK